MQTNRQPNYITQINAFHRFTACQYLPPNAQLLWFKLMHLCNTCGWPEWLQIDTLRLTALLGAADKKAALRARDALVEAGLLEHVPGCKGRPSRYRLTDLASVTCTNEESSESSTGNGTENGSGNSTENGTEYGVENEPKTGRIIRQDKEKTRRDDSLVPAELAPVWRAYAEMRKKMRKPLTDSAARLVLQTLGTLAPDRPDEMRKILEQSILNGWAGVFPLKKEEAPEPPASYDIAEFERRLLYGKIEYRKRN